MLKQTLDLTVRSVKTESQALCGRSHDEKACTWDPRHTGVILCDLWDRHWCRGAAARVNELAPRIEAVLQNLRDRGCLIVHAPSDTMAFYATHPARIRLLQAAAQKVLVLSEAGQKRLEQEPPIPVDPKRKECDCGPEKCVSQVVWSRQHPGITIMEQDLIGDSFDILQAFQHYQINQVLIMGVHTNLCVVGRNFGIRNLVRYGFQPLLVRDMTDCMAPRDEFPFVDHMTALDYVIYHIETYLCGTIDSGQILEDGQVFKFHEDQRTRHAPYAEYAALT
jgi:nicotinamidase-related amidase